MLPLKILFKIITNSFPAYIPNKEYVVEIMKQTHTHTHTYAMALRAHTKQHNTVWHIQTGIVNKTWERQPKELSDKK